MDKLSVDNKSNTVLSQSLSSSLNRTDLLDDTLNKYLNISTLPPVRKTQIFYLQEFQNCTYGDCLGLKNIEKIEIVSFVLEKRKARGNWESSGETQTSKELIDKLRFGSWSNPECANAEIGKWRGTGWHYPAGSCGSGKGNKFTAVEKVTVKVTYIGKE